MKIDIDYWYGEVLEGMRELRMKTMLDKDKNRVDRIFGTLRTCWEGITRTNELNVHTIDLTRKLENIMISLIIFVLNTMFL